jgi:hypothetical protein
VACPPYEHQRCDRDVDFLLSLYMLDATAPDPLNIAAPVSQITFDFADKEQIFKELPSGVDV